MINHIPRIACILFLASIHLFCFAAMGYADPLSQAELDFVHLVNQVRTDPMPVVEEMGWPTEELVDSGLLLGGMQPLELNDRLTQAAREKAREILTLNYYSHVSPDGVTPIERIADKGYQVFDSEQSMAVLSFRNFLSSREAIRSILGNLLTDEAGSHANRKLFNPVFRDIGLSMESGDVKLEGKQYSVYLLVVNVAVSNEYAVESALLQLINNLRQNPDLPLSADGNGKSADTDATLEPAKKKPLARHELLDQVAASGLSGPIQGSGGVLSVHEQAGIRSLIASYNPQAMTHTHIKIRMEKESSIWQKAEAFLSTLLRQEAESAEGLQHVLRSDLSEVGMQVSLDTDDEADHAELTLVAADPHDSRSHVLGGVYAWRYIDDAMQDIEGLGIAGMCVELADLDVGEVTARSWSDVLGRYQLPVKEKAYRLNLRNIRGMHLSTRHHKALNKNRMAQFWTPLENPEIENMYFTDQAFIW